MKGFRYLIHDRYSRKITNNMANSLYEMRLQGIMVAVFIILD